ncbi:MAG: hypothetical protein U1G07_24275 [Verrucomicrobiota bacterium]
MFPGLSKSRFALLTALLGQVVLFSSVRAQPLPVLTPSIVGSVSLSNLVSVINNDPAAHSSYTIVGGGNELWGDVDKGEFAHFPVSGDFDVQVRVEALEPVHRYAKAGLMVREGLNTADRMVSLFATPAGPTELPPETPTGSDNVEFNFRRGPLDGKNSINLGSPGFPHAWLRLARRGSVFYGMIGQDGTNWTISALVETASWPGGAFAANALVGLGVSSHDDTRTVKADFRQLGNTAAVGPIRLTEQPGARTGLLDHSVTFTTAVNDPVDARYQWAADGVPIAGATNNTYTTPRLTAADDRKAYSVTVSGPGNTITSSNALLSVVAIDPPANPLAIYDFDDGEVPGGTSVYGTALVDPAGGFGAGGGLILTTNLNGQNGSFVIDDLNPGSAVASFTLAFKLMIGPGSANPADGVSVSFGPSIPNGTFVAPQQGVGPGLAVSFDIYDNGDGEAPAIDVFYGVDPAMVPQNFMGNIVHRSLPKPRLVNARFVEVILHMSAEGKLDLAYDGEVIAYQVQTPYVPAVGARFGFGAYSGGQNARQSIDDIAIETTVQNDAAYLQSLGPLGNAVAANAEIVAKLTDLSSLVDTNSIQLRFNDQPVTARVVKDLDLTTVRYQPPNLLAANSTNTTTLIWSDDALPPNRHTNTTSFKVFNYATLPPVMALPLSSAEATNRGFRLRVYQIDGQLAATSQAAEDVLAGRRGPNVAEATAVAADGLVRDPGAAMIIDYDVNPGQRGTVFPGIPGSTGSHENFAAEIVAYLELPSAGYYPMAIRSDDGFKLWAGTPENELVLLALYEGAREPLDSVFGFAVSKPGLYPFRLLYYQAGGGALLRWSELTEDGTQIIVNDPDDEAALRAFRSVPGNAPGPVLTIQAQGSELELTWVGSARLESTADLGGPWSPVPAAASPFRLTPGTQQFYRLRSGP